MRFDDEIREALKDGRVQASGWVRVNCPGFCEALGRGPDTRASFGFNTKTGGYSCNRCKSHGKLSGHHEAGSRAGKSTPRPISAQNFIPLNRHEAEALSVRPAYSYMRHRGFTDEDLARARVRCAVVGKYAGRVIVPHEDEGGKLWGFTARCWVEPTDDIPKILYPAGMPRRLYNGQALKIETQEPVIIVEGCFDAIKFLPDVCACLGKPTEQHFEEELLLAKRPIVFALDGDAWEEGVGWAMRLLFRGVPATSIRLPAGEDPATVKSSWLISSARDAASRIPGY